MSVTDAVIKVMNFFLLLFKPRKSSNFRWANSARDALNFVGQFADGQFTKIYGRITSRYNYHPLQIYENKIRQFNVTEAMQASMLQYGNLAFYQSVCGLANPGQQRNFASDLTKIDDLPTASSAGDYLYQQVYHRKLSKSHGTNAEQFAREAAEIARTNYMRGFTRVVNASDYGDWERLRCELRSKQHVAKTINDRPEDRVTLIALSYKGKDVNITRRMQLLEDDGTPDKELGVVRTTIEMTSDFLDDFRWSQLVRSCMEIARQRNTKSVRVWIDRLVMMGYTPDEIARRYLLADWEEFGLFAYAVCPVVRLYDANEKYFGSDFWRKLETILGVAGKGIVVDDYMLRKFDETIFYGPEMYERYENGLSRIGGYGIYVRATTLALATAILTDGLSTGAANEDIRTKAAVVGWKAWALRTIGEGAYSTDHFAMMAQEDVFQVGIDKFLIIAFWESMVSRSPYLTGKSYMDMSFQKSMTWRRSSRWDGVLEWLGMIENSCKVFDKVDIKTFISENIDIELWASTTGHVACWMTLYNTNRMHRRSIVVNLSRFSTATQGHVTAVAEATGLWKEKVLPFYLKHIPLPDEDQSAEVTDEGILYSYKPMKIVYRWMPMLQVIGLVLFNLTLLWVAVAFSLGAIGIVIVIQVSWISWICLQYLQWPWFDQTDVGEALFDNLLLHSLFGSGIKTQYRKLQKCHYHQIGWT